MKKKIVISAIVGGMLLAPASVNLGNILNQEPVVETNVAEAAWPKWILKLIWPIASKAGNYAYSVTPSYTTSTYADELTPGHITYNNGVYGASSKFDVNFISTNHSVILYADTSIFNWTTKIAILLTSPSGSDVVNKSVDAQQWVRYRPSQSGTFTARFVQTKSQSWAPYIVYRYDDGGLSMMSSTESNIDTDKKFVVDEKYGNIILPSENHQKVGVFNVNAKGINNLTADELDKQFYDTSLGIHVYAMKDYKAGDIVNFKDVILDVQYDETEDVTLFTFAGEHVIKFKNNLEDQYKVGDSLELKFAVEKVSDENPNLELIDYIKYSFDNNSEIPKIDGFLKYNN